MVVLSPAEFDEVSTVYASFLQRERERYYVRALALDSSQKSGLRGYFRDELLDATRVHQLKGEHLSTPDFYPKLLKMGLKNLPDFEMIEAATFIDVIVFAAPMSNRLLFHELVHAEQFRQLGTTGLARRYLDGFLKGGTYEAIPLEIQAYGLGAHSESDPRRPFSVEEEVSRWMHEGKV